MTVNVGPLELTNFDGGLTDNDLSGAVNKWKRADNLVLIQHGGEKKLKSRSGSQIYDGTYYQIPAGIQRIGKLKYFNTLAKMLTFSERNIYYIAGAYNTLLGPTSNKAFPSTVSTTNYVSLTEWNKHLFYTSDAYTQPGKIYVDGSAVLQLRTAGLPLLAADPTITGTAGANNYLYRFVHTYTYASGTLTFVDFGPTREVAKDNINEPSVSTVAITVIPVLANAAVTNWDTSVIKIGIFRTINDGDTFYKVGEVTNGTTTFNDTVSDASLQNNEELYTNGGVVDNDLPPLCKFVHVQGDTAAYANIKVGSELFEDEMRVSIPGDVDSVPETFSVSLGDRITGGISSFKGFFIAVCENTTWRIEGGFDELGRGGLFPIKISDTVGGQSPQSLVQTLEGVFWAGPDGFYYTDGYNVIRITQEWETTYNSFVNTTEKRSRLMGAYDKRERRILWAVQQDATDCDTVYCLDLKSGIKQDSAFTTLSNGTDFRPTAIEFEGINLVRGDTRGYLFKHADNLYSDYKVDTSTNPSNWYKKTIIFDYISTAINFGSSFERKFATRCILTAKNETNVSVQIISINDEGRNITSLKPIRFRQNIIWGDPDVIWGDPSLTWNFGGLIEEQRRFPATSLRCSYKQVQITNANVIVATSDLLGTATVNAVAKTATLTRATVVWNTQAVDYYIAFENDDYTKQYLITARTATEITFIDSQNSAPIGIQHWEMFGKHKDEALYLLSFTYEFASFGRTQGVYTPAEGAGVGSS